MEPGQMADPSENKTVERSRKARRRAVMDWQYSWKMTIKTVVFMTAMTTIIIGGMKLIGAL